MADEFQWPEPGRDEWEVEGVELGMDPDVVKFCAAVQQMGGLAAVSDGRFSNTAAARMAGLDWDRGKAFKTLQGKNVRTLLRWAAEYKDMGRPPPLTEEEIEDKLAKMIRSGDFMAVSRALDLREKRLARAREERLEAALDAAPEPIVTLDDIFAHCCSTEAILLLYGEMMLRGGTVPGNKIGIGVDCHSPAMRLMVPKFKQQLPELWPKYRADLVGAVGQMESFLRELEAEPVLEWTEIARRVHEEAARYRRGGGVPPSNGGAPVEPAQSEAA
jgi:hypothetical protein